MSFRTPALHALVPFCILWGLLSLTVPVLAESNPPIYQVQEPGKGAVVFVLDDPTGILADRSVTATASLGPADDAAGSVTLSGLNDFSAAIELAPGDYYCTAAVDYDPAMDYPLSEVNGFSSVSLAAGETVVLTYTVGNNSFYQSITGKSRFFSTVELEPAPTDYDAAMTAVVGVYLTAPVGFDNPVTVYLANRYTGTGYTLEVYASNQLAAQIATAQAGRYQYLGVYLPNDTAGRYQITAEQDILDTGTSKLFHLTVIDSQNPDRELATPSRDSTSGQTVVSTPVTAATTPTPTPTTTTAPDKKPAVHLPIVELVILFVAGTVLLLGRKQHKKKLKK